MAQLLFGESEERITHTSRVGHRVLFRSECIVLLRSFKERNVLLHSFFEFLATYENQKNDALLHSFLKNVKERRECNIILQRT